MSVGLVYIGTERRDELEGWMVNSYRGSFSGLQEKCFHNQCMDAKEDLGKTLAHLVHEYVCLYDEKLTFKECKGCSSKMAAAALLLLLLFPCRALVR